MTKKVWLGILIATLTFLGGQTAPADTIRTNDGSLIKGKITGTKGGKIVIETEFAGVVSIVPDTIVGITTENVVHITLHSGNTFVGKLEDRQTEEVIHLEAGTVDVSNDAVKAIWLPGQENPLLDRLKKYAWKFELGLTISGKTGNTEKFGTGGRFRALKQTENDRLRLYLKGERSEENRIKTLEEIFAGIDYESRFFKQSSWYTRVEFESDDIEGVDLRTTTAAGLGYYFIKREEHELRIRLGLQYRHESFTDNTTKESPGLDLAFYRMRWFKDWGGKLTSEITYTPSFENIRDYRVYHESTLDVPLAFSDIWELQIGISNEYNSITPKNIEHLDTTYFSRVVLKWE